ncbi:hypothetical protein TSAR_014707 [Trichomalopsis sarcophagae]|uniref:Uncharacterized protein n=1 Tax=Trichomalopsis sarcophagae TaxID=543379 RepID=A0A232EUI9_9HYME|nr:hypothetical protein TSAR_014707 [Trichomalopsis sarcophagae]
MSTPKTSTNNTELIKLSNKIEKLTKIVDNLQKEVKSMKRNKSYRNEIQHWEINKSKTSTKSENKSKTNPFDRLKFFRENGKTSEKSVTYVDSDKKKDKDRSKGKAKNDQQLGTIKKSDRTDLPITPKKKRSHLTHLNSDDNDVRINKQSDLVCSVKDCSVQTNNDNRELSTQHKISSKNKKEKKSEQLDKEVIKLKSKSKLKSSCDGCAKSKSNSKFSQCAKGCPYLDKRQAIDKETKIENVESKLKEDKIGSNVQTLNNQDYMIDNQHNVKRFKNKKIMVNLIRDSNEESLKNIQDNENLKINCRFIEDVDLSNIRNLKQSSSDIVSSSAHAAERSKEKRNGCNKCSQNYGPKTVLKINKAILAPDPPMIFLSSKDSSKSESRRRKKSLIKKCEQFLKKRKSKQCHSDYQPRTCCSTHHDEFSETFN